MKTNCVPGYCDADYTCRKNYDTAREKHSRTASIIIIASGVMTLLIGLFLKVEGVSFGVMASGVFLTFYGVVAHWNYLSKYVRLVLLGILLILLIWVGYKKFGKK